MVEEIVIEGVAYIAGKHAASLIGLSPDYVTRWCREGLVDARRVAGGIWFVNKQSLESYLVAREERRREWREELRENRRGERGHNQPGIRLA